MTESYFNTTNVSGQQLRDYEAKASSQADRIIEFMRHGRPNLTPTEAWREVFDCGVPITSVRRAMTCLTNNGRLIKTKIQRESGQYNRPEYVWKLPPTTPEQGSLL